MGTIVRLKKSFWGTLHELKKEWFEEFMSSTKTSFPHFKPTYRQITWLHIIKICFSDRYANLLSIFGNIIQEKASRPRVHVRICERIKQGWLHRWETAETRSTSFGAVPSFTEARRFAAICICSVMKSMDWSRKQNKMSQKSMSAC